jgi:hypothetical protein
VLEVTFESLNLNFLDYSNLAKMEPDQIKTVSWFRGTVECLVPKFKARQGAKGEHCSRCDYYLE